MGLFIKKHQDELIDLNNRLDTILKQAPLLISAQEAQAQMEIKKLPSTREIQYLKKRMWKFYHKNN